MKIKKLLYIARKKTDLTLKENATQNIADEKKTLKLKKNIKKMKSIKKK